MDRSVVIVLVGAAAAAVAAVAADAVAADSAQGGGNAEPGRWFTWREFEASGTAAQKGIDNTIPAGVAGAEIRQGIRTLVRELLDPLRSALGRPVRITGGWRSPQLQAALLDRPGQLAAAEGSRHTLGWAADIAVDGMDAGEIAAEIIRLGLPFEQLIWYAPERGGHVHVEVDPTKQVQAGEVLHGLAGASREPAQLPAGVTGPLTRPRALRSLGVS